MVRARVSQVSPARGSIAIPKTGSIKNVKTKVIIMNSCLCITNAKGCICVRGMD